MRLRQAVLVARELEPVVAELRDQLGLGEPYNDPGVGLFGLRNAVMPIGDAFLEVVSPVQDGTAAGRQLDRLGGDGGYMAIFQVADLTAARGRAAALGVRTAWEIDLDDIAATHLHPADVPGAIVSIDRPDPPESWRWGGPDWTGQAGPAGGGSLDGLTVEVPDPAFARERWAAVLGAEPPVVFVEGDRGIIEIRVSGVGAHRSVQIGSVCIAAAPSSQGDNFSVVQAAREDKNSVS